MSGSRNTILKVPASPGRRSGLDRALLSLGAASAAIVLCLFTGGCASNRTDIAAGLVEDTEADKREKFRGEWWQYYDRGAIRLNDLRYEEAEADFRKALNRRRRDGKWVRTYGIRFHRRAVLWGEI